MQKSQQRGALEIAIKDKDMMMRVNTRNADKLELDGEAIDKVKNFT